MNQIGFAKRKNSNKVLFHFDSLVDLHLAVVYALQKDYPSGGSIQSINYSFLHQSKMELKRHRIFDIGKEVIQECFLGPMRDKWQSTYKIYMEEEFDRVISDAPITPMLRLIAAFSRVGRGSHVSSSIFCENYNQARIARAMLKDAPIVILDEATSALDNKSEAIVQKALDNLMQNKTVFVIAHRLSTIKNADKIAVINEGELVELGTHDELLCRENGFYKKLYEMQFAKSSVGVTQ